MRFGIRHLMLAVALVALFGGLFVMARHRYYKERRETHLTLAQVKGISNIEIRTYVEEFEEVASSSFSVDDVPGSIIEIGNLNDYLDHGRIYLNRIGKWKFRISGRGHLGAVDANTGKPVESSYIGSYIAVGSNSPFKELIHFEINSLQDLVDHYQELNDLFESWPRQTNPGTIQLEDGNLLHYSVTPDGGG